jgi:hypothetical protein
MDEIDKIKMAISKVKEMESDLEGNLQAEYTKIFEDSPLIKDALSALENTIFHGYFEGSEWPARWARVDLKKFHDCLPHLKEYLSENHYCFYDPKNEVIYDFGSPAIIINEDGDILDQDKIEWFLSKDDYGDDENLRNQLIERYMEKNGYFPSVFIQTPHGDLFLLNTQEKV